MLIVSSEASPVIHAKSRETVPYRAVHVVFMLGPRFTLPPSLPSYEEFSWGERFGRPGCIAFPSVYNCYMYRKEANCSDRLAGGRAMLRLMVLCTGFSLHYRPHVPRRAASLTMGDQSAAAATEAAPLSAARTLHAQTRDLEMENLRQEGLTLQAIATRYNITRERVRQRLLRCNVSGTTTRPSSETDALLYSTYVLAPAARGQIFDHSSAMDEVERHASALDVSTVGLARRLRKAGAHVERYLPCQIVLPCP